MTSEELLLAAIRSGLTVVIDGDVLVIRGSGCRPAEILDALSSRAEEIVQILRCWHCCRADRPLILTHWGERLCRSCCIHAAGEHNAHDSWPAVEWDAAEINQLAGGHR
jgi:hypothetical protein